MEAPSLKTETLSEFKIALSNVAIERNTSYFVSVYNTNQDPISYKVLF